MRLGWASVEVDGKDDGMAWLVWDGVCGWLLQEM